MNTQNETPSFLDLVLGPWLNGTADFLQDGERTLMQTLAQEELAQLREQTQKLSPQHVIRIEAFLISYLLARRADKKALCAQPDSETAPSRAANAETQIAAKANDRLRKSMKELDAMLPKPTEEKKKKRQTVYQRLQPILEKSKGAMEEILRREALETEPRTEETRRIEQEEFNRMLERELAREAAEGWN